MNESQTIVVVGLGEVGKPLYSLVSQYYHATGIDVPLPAALPNDVDIVHICYPFQIRDFVGEVERYI